MRGFGFVLIAKLKGVVLYRLAAGAGFGLVKSLDSQRAAELT